ncbi:hypothetical protein P950_02650 [Mycobacterium tuberculosis KT-0057]|nr:hypothetical protein P950_02650 [Mycobacterium tuberculosis KT-0057]
MRRVARVGFRAIASSALVAGCGGSPALDSGRSQARRLSPGAAGRPRWIQGDRKLGACRRVRRVARVGFRAIASSALVAGCGGSPALDSGRSQARRLSPGAAGRPRWIQGDRKLGACRRVRRVARVGFRAIASSALVAGCGGSPALDSGRSQARRLSPGAAGRPRWIQGDRKLGACRRVRRVARVGFRAIASSALVAGCGGSPALDSGRSQARRLSPGAAGRPRWIQGDRKLGACRRVRRVARVGFRAIASSALVAGCGGSPALDSGRSQARRLSPGAAGRPRWIQGDRKLGACRRVRRVARVGFRAIASSALVAGCGGSPALDSGRSQARRLSPGAAGRPRWIQGDRKLGACRRVRRVARVGFRAIASSALVAGCGGSPALDSGRSQARRLSPGAAGRPRWIQGDRKLGACRRVRRVARVGFRAIASSALVAGCGGSPALDSGRSQARRLSPGAAGRPRWIQGDRKLGACRRVRRVARVGFRAIASSALVAGCGGSPALDSGRSQARRLSPGAAGRPRWIQGDRKLGACRRVRRVARVGFRAIASSALVAGCGGSPALDSGRSQARRLSPGAAGRPRWIQGDRKLGACRRVRRVARVGFRAIASSALVAGCGGSPALDSGRSQARRLSPGAAGRPRWIQGDRKLGACRRVRRVARVGFRAIASSALVAGCGGSPALDSGRSQARRLSPGAAGRPRWIQGDRKLGACRRVRRVARVGFRAIASSALVAGCGGSPALDSGRSQARRLSPGAAGRPRWIQGDRKLGACRRVRRVARVGFRAIASSALVAGCGGSPALDSGRSQARRLSPGAAGRPRWIQGDRKLGACRRVRRVARVRVLRADTMRSDQVMSLGRVILVL